ncbi:MULTISPECIES: DUF6263 family protein [unclassified Corynebacterium]|uniref:DUF6263 family protein n=1 Tax=unclassified Corynebacterium TaxID=2624378 RepID=UPI0030AC0071
MKRRIITLCAGIPVVAGLSLSSCSSDTAVPETMPIEISSPKVTLLDDGDGETAKVRWHDDGAEQTNSVIITQGFVQKGADEQSDSTFPDTRLEMPLTTKATAGESRAVTATVGKPFGSNAELNEDIGTAEGFVMEWTAKDTGLIEEMKVGAPDKASETARAGIEAALHQLNDVPVVFPDEAIGKGASWTVENEVSSSTAMQQKITYTLKEREGDVLTLNVAVEQAPAVTELDAGEGAKLTVVDAKTETREGRLVIDVTKPLPVEGTIDYVTEVIYGDGASDTRIVQQAHRALQFQ